MERRDVIRFNLPNRPEYCDVVRLTAAGIARKAGFKDEGIDDIKTAVSEACINVVRHAYNGKGGEMRLSFFIASDGLEVLVEDSGDGFDVNGAMEKAVALDPNQPRTSGFGLLIMRSLMDEVEIISEPKSGSRVRLKKHLSAT